MKNLSVRATSCFGPNDDEFVEVAAKMLADFDVQLVGTDDLCGMELDCYMSGEFDAVVAAAKFWVNDDCVDARLSADN